MHNHCRSWVKRCVAIQCPRCPLSAVSPIAPIQGICLKRRNVPKPTLFAGCPELVLPLSNRKCVHIPKRVRIGSFESLPVIEIGQRRGTWKLFFEHFEHVRREIEAQKRKAMLCVYRKPKPGHSGDEGRQGSGVNL
jgi:hypothetical protein